METINLKRTTHLKALLQNYVAVCYEDNLPSRVTDDLLEQEYEQLKAEGKLERLFECEMLMCAGSEQN
ncbi:MAG: hypothetical protein OEW75_06985 [Cyclobacteriaceae bacterium]|nr:hypothetical protein [Cyclobacteriaceae bacterium]